MATRPRLQEGGFERRVERRMSLPCQASREALVEMHRRYRLQPQREPNWQQFRRLAQRIPFTRDLNDAAAETAVAASDSGQRRIVPEGGARAIP
jgi:hypothetical protein